MPRYKVTFEFNWKDGSNGVSVIYPKDNQWIHKFHAQLVYQGCTDIIYRKEILDETQENG